METVVYQSPRKHRIIAIQNLLIKNNIPVTSIKLHICVSSRDVIGGGRRGNIVQIERSDDLNVPIEEFNEKLSDVQTFEVYTDAQYETKAMALIEKCDEETFFDDCIFKSNNYDEAFEIYLQLIRNNISCDEVATIFAENGEEYALFTDPDEKESAIRLINQSDKPEPKIYETDNTTQSEFFDSEKREKSISRYILPAIIIVCILLLRIDNQFIIEIIIGKIEIIIKGLGNGKLY
jgi:hypothetical protein